MADVGSVSPNVQDYAKAVYALESRSSGEAVSTNDLAERLGVTPGSVSAMVRKLDRARSGRARALPRRAADRAGPAVALEVLRHHRLLELFLARGAGDAAGTACTPRPRCSSTSSPRSSRQLIADAPRGPDGRPARRSDPHARVRDRRARRPAAWTSSRPAPPGASCACRTPIRRCCATSPSRASRSAIASRSSVASRSAGRCSCASASASMAIGGELAQRDADRARGGVER